MKTMSTLPIRQFNPGEIHAQVFWMILGWAFGNVMNHLIKRNLKITKIDVKRFLYWFQFIVRILLNIGLIGISKFFEFIRIKQVSGKIDSIIIREMFNAFLVFFKMNPKFGYKVFKVLEIANEQMKLESITGIKKDIEPKIEEIFETEDEVEKNLPPIL